MHKEPTIYFLTESENFCSHETKIIYFIWTYKIMMYSFELYQHVLIQG
jgi:hypothetical protein